MSDDAEDVRDLGLRGTAAPDPDPDPEHDPDPDRAGSGGPGVGAPRERDPGFGEPGHADGPEAPMTGVVGYVYEVEAQEAARRLIEHGIGALVESSDVAVGADGAAAAVPDGAASGDPWGDGGADAGDPGEPPPEVVRGFAVLVLDHDARRASTILGLAEPEDRPEANPVEPMKPVRAKTPWGRVLLIWLAAMIIIPLVAFWLTYEISSR
jgi:hypothetical protein